MVDRRPTFKGRRPPGPLGSADKTAILDYLKKLAEKLEKDTLSINDIKSDGHVNYNTIIRAFGGFSEALIQADLNPGRTYKRNPDSMLAQLIELTSTLGRTPSKTEIDKNLKYNARHYERQFGSIAKAVELASVSGKQTENPDDRTSVPPPDTLLVRTRTRRKYGQTIDFRGLRHAPINELGVVFLFGMLADDLGFVVESVQNGFPDCDAKLRKPDGSFEGVRIEFEFKSSSFVQHGHNVEECDLIICWQHDWRDCPIDVLELSKVIHNLPPLTR